MAKIPEVLQAIEEYLAKKGKGDDYLAKKITELFEKEDSPFNIRGTIVKKLKENLEKINKGYENQIENTAKFNEKLEKVTSALNLTKFNNLTSPFEDFKEKFKNVTSALNLNDFKFLTSPFKDFKQKLEDATSALDLKKIKGLSSVSFPSFKNFKTTMESLRKQMQNFKNTIQPGLSSTLFKRISELSNTLGHLDNAAHGALLTATTPTVRTSTTIDVNVKSIDSSLIKTLEKIFKKINISAIATVTKDKDQKEGIVGKIIKTIIGSVAVLAGIGFISKFLNETPTGRVIKASLGILKDKAIAFLKPYVGKLLDYVWEGAKVVFVELPKMFLKSTFKFFGLKELLGKENEGLAVLLTKGIYYGVKKMFFGFLNKMSFGMFGKAGSFLLSQTEKLGGFLTKLGNKIFEPFTASFKAASKLGSKVGGISGFFKKIASIPKAVGNFFTRILGIGAGGGLTKMLSGIAKLGGGGILKFLGSALKGIAKKIPFIGAVISLKDAVDRFRSKDYTGGLISIGSGIASFFPGIGTAISIGLDVLNAVLDNKTEGGKTSKMSLLSDWIGNLTDGFVEGIKFFFGDLFGGIGNMLKDAGKFLWDKAKAWLGLGDKQPVPDFPDSKDKAKPLQPVPLTNIQTTEKTQKVSDGIMTPDRKIKVIPDSADFGYFMKEGGPLGKAIESLDKRMIQLASIFSDGVQLIANTSAQGSAGIIKAVSASSANSGNSGGVAAGQNMTRDPIEDYRRRAERFIEYGLHHK